MPTWPARAKLNIDPDRLIELTDSAATTGTADEALIEELRVDSVGLVESYCTGYVVPFVDPPPNVVEWALAIWRYKIYGHRPEMTCPDTVRDDYARAMRALEKVADPAQGIALNAPAKPTGLPPSQTAGGLVENIERQFGRGRDGLG